MSDKDSIKNKEAGSAKMLIAMVGIGLVCALLIVFTYESTFAVIEKNKAEALEKAIFKVLPGITSTKSYMLIGMNLVLIDETTEEEEKVYAGYDNNGKLKGIAIEAAGQGYADVIRILYGYNPVKETVVGFYVLETKETPGLGDKIEKDDKFLVNFKKLDVALSKDKNSTANKVVTVKNGAKTNPWEIDGITGATISSRAIGEILGRSTEYWLPIIQKNKDKLMPTQSIKE